jgi:hypothetical protein
VGAASAHLAGSATRSGAKDRSPSLQPAERDLLDQREDVALEGGEVDELTLHFRGVAQGRRDLKSDGPRAVRVHLARSSVFAAITVRRVAAPQLSYPPRGICNGVAVGDSLRTGVKTGQPSRVGYRNPPAEHRFRRGQSGNPGGRPKGIARITRELLGDDGEAAVRFLAAVMDGGPLPDGAVPSVAERITAAKLLIERGWGRAPEFAPVEDRDPLELRGGDEDLAASFDRRMGELGEKRVERERQHEAG